MIEDRKSEYLQVEDSLLTGCLQALI